MTSASPASPAAPPTSVDALLRRISEEYAGLSRQLKLIARHVERHGDHLGLEKIQEVAERCAVQPSAVVRFAKRFGFTGYTELQKLFRDGISQQIAPSRNYQARIRAVVEQARGRLSSADIAGEFIAGAIDGLHELRRNLHGATLGHAVELLADAPALWVVGARRSFPVAAYLAYALQHTDKPVQLVTGVGSMNESQLRSLRARDVMIAVSFTPYANETLLAAQLAAARGASLIAITDSRMSPIATQAQSVLLVQESSTFGFRALSNVMALAQSLFIALAYRLELDNPSPVPASSGSAARRPPVQRHTPSKRIQA
jgi:DNA-binding MurR/RpiR family transcriptional regulator